MYRLNLKISFPYLLLLYHYYIEECRLSQQGGVGITVKLSEKGRWGIAKTRCYGE
jgi:hypothetical protein